MRTEICIKFKRKWEYIFIACLYVNAVPERNDVTGVEANGLSYPVAIDMRIWNGFYTIPKISGVRQWMWIPIWAVVPLAVSMIVQIF